MKTFILSSFFLFATVASAQIVIKKSSLKEAEQYKYSQPQAEKKISRSFAGGKSKKESAEKQPEQVEFKSENSEVQYWQYSE